MTVEELLKEIEAWLSFNTEPSREETAKLRKSIKDHLTEQLLIHDVVGRSELLKSFVEWQIQGNTPYAGMLIDEHIRAYFKSL